MIIAELNKVARLVGNVVFKMPGVSAVSIYGSLAEGYADKHSDINLIAVCSAVPDPEKRRKFFEQNFDWIIFKNNILPEWRTKTQDFFFVQGKKVNVIYKNKKNLEFVANQIAAGVHMSRDLFREAVSYIFNTKVIKDSNKIFEQLRKKIPSATPQLLKYFLPDLEHMALKDEWPHSKLKQAIDRGNYFYIDQIINLQLENFLICLHAINNRHYTSPKWVMKSIRELKLKPKATPSRIQRIASLSNSPVNLNKKLNLLQSLVSDLNKLILKQKIFNFLE